jgi:hypothetical protein
MSRGQNRLRILEMGGTFLLQAIIVAPKVASADAFGSVGVPTRVWLGSVYCVVIVFGSVKSHFRFIDCQVGFVVRLSDVVGVEERDLPFAVPVLISGLFCGSS